MTKHEHQQKYRKKHTRTHSKEEDTENPKQQSGKKERRKRHKKKNNENRGIILFAKPQSYQKLLNVLTRENTNDKFAFQFNTLIIIQKRRRKKKQTPEIIEKGFKKYHIYV